MTPLRRPRCERRSPLSGRARRILIALGCLGAGAWALLGTPARAGEWTTAAGDAQRTARVRGTRS